MIFPFGASLWGVMFLLCEKRLKKHLQFNRIETVIGLRAAKKEKDMPLEIIRNDITRVRADAIVNTANPKVAIGAGTDAAIYKAAGAEQLLAARAKIGELRPSEAACTPAFGLDAKYIIHTVGPAWQGGGKGEIETVAACYKNSLAMAKELGCESVAFPLISAGTYGFPKDLALKTAVSEISGFLFANDMTVYLVVYNREVFEVSGKAFSDIRSYIEEKDIIKTQRSREEMQRRLELIESLDSEQLLNSPYRSATPRSAGSVSSAPYSADRAPSAPSAAPDAGSRPFPPARASKAKRPSFFREEAAPEKKSGSIDDAIKTKEETFQQYLFRIIDRKGLTDPEVYKKANIDRKHFSKIRSNPDYSPKKKTVMALAIALELNLDETRDLLLKAGMALSRSSVFDIIMEYCIENEIRDVYDINCILFKYGQPTLGA